MTPLPSSVSHPLGSFVIENILKTYYAFNIENNVYEKETSDILMLS